MAPLANALCWNLKGGDLRSWRKVTVLEDITDVGVEVTVDGLGKELCREIGLLKTVGGLLTFRRASTADADDRCHFDDLLFLAGAFDVAVLAVVEVLAEDDAEGTTEILGDLVTVGVALARELIFQIGGLDGGFCPLVGETRTDDALAVEGLGYNAE